jgi:diguanylate cyclase (GGDEF)-like protein/PAS domain S-box-containing protein
MSVPKATTLQSPDEALAIAAKVFDATRDGIVVTTPSGSIVYVNDAYVSIHGYERADLLGRNPRILKSERHSDDFYRAMWDSLLKTGQWQGEIWDRRANGSLVVKWLSISAVKDDAGNTTHYVGVFSDITAAKEGEAALQWHSTHDYLTRLPNRALLEDRLAAALARSHREENSTAVVFIDLDGFKDVNSALGYAAGDRLLIEIARRCAAIVREIDTIGRSGGDEFMIIVAGFSDIDDLGLLAHRIRSAIVEPLMLDGQEVCVTASLGIAVYPEDGIDAGELTRHADDAMHRAERPGGDRAEFFGAELQDVMEHRVGIEARLREALREDRLFVVYQPQVDLNTGCIVGVEALIRWRDIDGTVIMPGDFIPVAESSGLILEIGGVALRRACADLRTLKDEGYRLTMAVNASARELMDQDVAIVIQVVNSSGIEPGDLEIEITESSIVARADVVAAKIATLRSYGVRVSIDDFGTGYASMTYVMDFHPSKLKIDRSFVTPLPDDTDAGAVVDATIALAKGIGAKALAEGPETAQHVRFLREHGCDIGQGYYFSRPIPLADLRVLLDAGPFSMPD